MLDNEFCSRDFKSGSYQWIPVSRRGAPKFSPNNLKLERTKITKNLKLNWNLIFGIQYLAILTKVKRMVCRHLMIMIMIGGSAVDIAIFLFPFLK